MTATQRGGAPAVTTSTTSLPLGLVAACLVLLAACGQDDVSRPGFPRTDRSPLTDAPLPYASPEDVGLSVDELWLFKERLYSRVVARHAVGGEILIIKDGRIVLHQAMGWADRERLVPLERNSIYRLASLTEPLVGTAVLMLAEEGRLSLDDPVADYLPSFDNERSGAITIRQLLTQRSGFVQGGQPSGFWTSPSLGAAVDLVGEVGPDAQPGEEFIDSHLNSATLGALVAADTDEPVERFLERRILEPLGLDDTHARFSPDDAWAPQVASSYHRWSGPWEKYWSPTGEEDFAWFSPSRGLYGSAFDYARFLATWMERGRYSGGQLLSEATMEEALSEPDPMLWEIYAPPSAPGALPVFGQRGVTGTLGVAFPGQDAIVIYLSGSEENDVVDEVIEAALEMFGSQRAEPVPPNRSP